MKYKIIEIFQDGSSWSNNLLYETKEEAVKLMLDYMAEDEEVGEKTVYKIVEEEDKYE